MPKNSPMAWRPSAVFSPGREAQSVTYSNGMAANRVRITSRNQGGLTVSRWVCGVPFDVWEDDELVLDGRLNVHGDLWVFRLSSTFFVGFGDFLRGRIGEIWDAALPDAAEKCDVSCCVVMGRGCHDEEDFKGRRLSTMEQGKEHQW